MKKFYYLSVFISLLVLLFFFQFTQCQRKPLDPTEIAARVGKQYLTWETVHSLIPKTMSKEDGNYLTKNLVDKWIERQVLAQTAQNEGIKLTPNDLWQIENVKLELYATKLLKEEIPQDFTVTDREIENYYKANQNQFMRQNDEVHIVHLFLEKLDKVIVSEIRQSQSLTEVIQKNFLDQQMTRVVEPNADLGYVEFDKLRPEFKRVIRGTKTGIIYGPIRTDEGYHFLQVLDRKPANSLRSLDLVRSEIVDILKMEKRQQMIRSYKEKIKKDFEVETFLSSVE